MMVEIDAATQELVLGGEARRTLADLVAVGEYTTASGPFLDDWFIVLGFQDGIMWEFPVYADMDLAFLRALGAELGHRLELRLANSTTWNHRLIYPPEVTDLPLFEAGPSSAGPVHRKLRQMLGLAPPGAWILNTRCGAPSTS